MAKTPPSYVTMIVMRSAQDARHMYDIVAPGTLITWPGYSTNGMRAEKIIVTLHPEEFVNDPRIRDWFETQVRTRLVPNGRIVNDYLDAVLAKPGTPFGVLEPRPDDQP